MVRRVIVKKDNFLRKLGKLLYQLKRELLILPKRKVIAKIYSIWHYLRK
tara:strand:- start:724 stop:870 length:147 start_codon:yes stop_codon:yes gene_type:complete